MFFLLKTMERIRQEQLVYAHAVSCMICEPLHI